MTTLETVWHGASWREQPSVPLPQKAQDARFGSGRVRSRDADDRVLASLPGVLSDVLKCTGLTYSQASDALARLVKSGHVRKIGYKPTRYVRVEAR